MKVEKNTMITIEDVEYAVVDKILYEGVDYLFANKYENDEPTDNYIVYELIDDTDVVLVTDKKIIEKLLPIFTKDIQKKIDEINIQQKYEIN